LESQQQDKSIARSVFKCTAPSAFTLLVFSALWTGSQKVFSQQKKGKKKKVKEVRRGKNSSWQGCMDVAAEHTDLLFSCVSLIGKWVGKIRQI